MTWYETITSTPALIAAGALGITAVYLKTRPPQQIQETAETGKARMAQADDPIAVSELSKHDGTDSTKPVYVAIKGRVFDVSSKKEMYGPGGSYHIFAGKDASKGLGMSSLDAKDAIADYSSLNEAQMKTLDQWESFFQKRYNIVGKVKP